MAYAFVRNLKTSTGANLKDFAQIQSAERHAKREDLTSKARQRPNGDHRQNYFWSRAGEGLDHGGADYAAAFKAHKAAHGIKTERKGAALGLHLLVGVSPEWLTQEGGDPRDLNNPYVQMLIEHAKLWAEEWMGKGAVWAVRYDTDEAGSGVVDILASPVRENRAGKAKTGKPSISVNKALKELQALYKEPTSYAAMQTSWADYMSSELDADLVRGKRVSETEREHVSPEAYKAGYEAGLQAGAAEAAESRREAQRAAQEAEKAHQVRMQAEVALVATERRLEALREKEGEILHRVEQLRRETVRLSAALDLARNLYASITETIRQAVPKFAEELIVRIDRAWDRDTTRNPQAMTEKPKPEPQQPASRRDSGPSGP